MNRRDVLKRTAVLGSVGALAGCLSSTTGSGGDDEEETTADGTGAGTTTDGSGKTTTRPPTPEIGSRSIETTETTCRSKSDSESASVSYGDAAVSVTGTIDASDPCHDAVLKRAAYDADGDTLTVVVGVKSTDGMCSSCLGAVDYSATVGFSTGLPGSVTVKHASRGKTETVARVTASETAPTETATSS